MITKARKLNSSMGKKASRERWERYWGEKHRVEEIYSNEDRIARNLQKVVSVEDLTILEVGAGTGRDSLLLTGNETRVFLVDYSFESLRLMRQTAVPNQFQIRGDAFRLPFQDETFDVVFHQGLLEHFRKPDADRLLLENIRVLKNGGYLLVDVPQRYHPYTLVKHILILLNKWFAGWERSYSFPELQSQLTQLGLKPVHRYGEWMVPSLLYRIIREIGKKIGVKLPLYPVGIPLLRKIRERIRNYLLKTLLPFFTGVNIGIVAVKSTIER